MKLISDDGVGSNLVEAERLRALLLPISHVTQVKILQAKQSGINISGSLKPEAMGVHLEQSFLRTLLHSFFCGKQVVRKLSYLQTSMRMYTLVALQKG
jgi:hypothetical protein